MDIQKIKKEELDLIMLSGNFLGETDSLPLLDAVKESLHQDRSKFIINMEGLKYMNSTGLGALLTCLTKSRNVGGDVVLINVPEHMNKLLLITKLNTIFQIAPSFEEGKQLFN